MLLLIYFVFILVYLTINKNRSVALIFVVIQIISLVGVLLIGQDYLIDTFNKGINFLYTALILSLIILPWKSMSDIRVITVSNEDKIKKLTYIIIGLSIIPFIVFGYISMHLLLETDNVNMFRTVNGISRGEYYDSLPINVNDMKLFSIAMYFYHLSNFLIPLHIYYLGRQKYRLSIICFILSLNILLAGFTYYSRASLISYLLIYLSVVYMLRDTLTNRLKLRLVSISLIITVMVGSYFMYLSDMRFADVSFYGQISQKSVIQDYRIYSYFEYLSQWYYNSMFLLDSYNFHTLRGQISLDSVLNFLGQYGLINYNSLNYLGLRMDLWQNNWYTFNGFVAYSVYDYGYLLTVLLSCVYYYVVLKYKPINNSVSLEHLFFIVLLIQIPLMAIFYSSVAVLISPALYLYPIYLYLRKA